MYVVLCTARSVQDGRQEMQKEGIRDGDGTSYLRGVLCLEYLLCIRGFFFFFFFFLRKKKSLSLPEPSCPMPLAISVLLMFVYVRAATVCRDTSVASEVTDVVSGRQ